MFGIFGTFFHSNVSELFFLIKSSCLRTTTVLCIWNPQERGTFKIIQGNCSYVELFIGLNSFYITIICTCHSLAGTKWEEVVPMNRERKKCFRRCCLVSCLGLRFGTAVLANIHVWLDQNIIGLRFLITYKPIQRTHKPIRSESM